MVFPESAEPAYARLAKNLVAKHGRTKQAELLGTVEMMSKAGGVLVSSDQALLDDPKIKAALSKIPFGEALQEQLDNGSKVDRNAVIDPVLEKAIKSVETDVHFPQPPLKSPLEMHADWKRYFQSRETSPTPGM